MGCRPSVPQHDPASHDPAIRVSRAPPVFHVGQPVQARWRGTWYDGRISSAGFTQGHYVIAWGTFDAQNRNSFAPDGTTTYVEADDIRPL